MTASSFVIDLKKQIASELWGRTLLALRQDSLVWSSLTTSDLGRRALAEFNQQWSPAGLALLALGSPCAPDTLADQPLQALPQPLRSRVARAYEEFQSRPLALPISLAQAGLWALSLRERRRIKGSWEGLIAELGPRLPALQTPLSCLYGMVPDPFDLLTTLSQPGVPPYLALHAVLSNPLTVEGQTETLYALLARLSRPEILRTLNLLQRQRPTMAAGLARRLLTHAELTAPSSIQSPILLSLETALQTADLQRLAELPEGAVQRLAMAQEDARSLLAHFSARLAHTYSEAGNALLSLQAWKQAVQFAPDDSLYRAGLAFSLLDAGSPEDAQSCLDAFEGVEVDSPHPTFLMAGAQLAALAEQGDQARSLARRAMLLAEERYTIPLEAVLLEQASEENPFASLPQPNEVLSDLARLHLKLCQFPEAAHAAHLSLAFAPNRIETLSALGEAELSLGLPSEAIEPIYAALALQPERVPLRRLLIRALETAGAWENALEERALLLEQQPNLSNPERLLDLRSMAFCALQARLPQRALHACREALGLSPQDGLSFTLLGEAYAALGDSEAARSCLDQAIQFAPAEAAPWLSLARIQRSEGTPQKALETLRTGSLSAPAAPEIHLALGLAYLNENNLTQALACLRQAYALAQANPSAASGFAVSLLTSLPYTLADQIAYHLGRTLYILGFLDESLKVLETTFRSLPSEQPYPDLAYAYAQVLLSLNQLSLALPPLQMVVNSQPNDPGPYLDLARSLLLLSPNQPEPAQQAIPLLHQVLQFTVSTSEPRWPTLRSEALALLAEALTAAGELAKAGEAYRQALETPLARTPDWNARLNLGLGHVALSLGQYETAIQALQEAAHSKPDDPLVHRSLSEAYLALGLLDDSMTAAGNALRLQPNDLQGLVWFALQCQDLHAKQFASALSEAMAALQKAVQMAPTRTDLLYRLGKLQLEAGHTGAALETFIRLSDSDFLFNQDEPHASPLDIFQAAQTLRQLGAPERAIALLERTLNHSRTEPLTAPLSSAGLLAELAAAHRQSGNLHAALQAVEHALSLAPERPELYRTRAELLIAMDRRSEAVTSLQSALALLPEDPELHFTLAQTLYETASLQPALSHAERAAALSNLETQPELHLQAETLAAELAFVLLQPQRAAQFLADPWIRQTNLSPTLIFPYACLKAELALEGGDESRASDALALVLETAPHHPRSLALQARLLTRQPESDPKGQLQASKTLLATALHSVQSLGEDCHPLLDLLPIWRGMTQAALGLSDWALALESAYRAVEIAPEQPLYHLQLTRALVLRGEAQRLAASFERIQEVPGEAALSKSSLQAFETALERLEASLRGPGTAPSSNDYEQVNRWKARGNSLFHPGQSSLQELQSLLESETPLAEDAAALILALGQNDQPAEAIKTAQRFQGHSWVLLHLALIFASTSPRQSLGVIASARGCLTASTPRAAEIEPLLDLLTARIALHSPHLVDHGTAVQAVRQALQALPDEPRWHALAAEVFLQAPSPSLQDLLEAITHLERAAQLEPGRASHYLALGQAFLTQGEPAQAILVLEQACRLAPESSENWFSLARAQQAAGMLDLAAENAEKAVETSSAPLPALLLRGQIALQAENPRGALQRAQAALRLKPSHPQALHLLAQAYEALNQPAEAVAALEEAIPQIPGALDLKLERARLVRKALGNESALKALQELAAEMPGEPTILSALALVQFDCGLKEAGLQSARLALQSDGSRLLPRDQAELHYRIGLELRQDGQLDQAIHQLNEAVHKDPDHLEAYLALGRTHMERRQHLPALSTFQQAIEIAQGDHRPYYQAALVMKEMKDYLGAESMLRKAADLAPEDLAIHRLLGFIVAQNLVYNRRPATAS